MRGYIANHAAAITAVTATAGGLVVGTSDGSVFCFQLGVLDPSAPGMNLLFPLWACVFLLPLFAFIVNFSCIICMSYWNLRLH